MSKFIGSYREGESAMILEVMQLPGRVCRDTRSHAALKFISASKSAVARNAVVRSLGVPRVTHARCTLVHPAFKRNVVFFKVE